jgi:hypothetical protein
MEKYKDPFNHRSPWFTKKEALEYTRLSQSTFDRKRKEKGARLRTFLIRGTEKCLRFHKDDLDRLIRG